MTLNVDSAPDECFGERKRALSWPPGEHPRLESFFEQVRRRIQELPDWIFEGGKAHVESVAVSSGDNINISLLISVNDNTDYIKVAASTEDFPTAQEVDDTAEVDVPDGETSVEVTDVISAPPDDQVFISVIAYDSRGCPGDSVWHDVIKDFGCCGGGDGLFGATDQVELIGAWDPFCASGCMSGTDDPDREVLDRSIYNISGSITKNTGFSWGNICPVAAPSGCGYDNAEGGSHLNIQNSRSQSHLQLQSDFTVMAWFLSRNDLTQSASFGQRDNVNNEGWSASVSADGTVASFGYYDNAGTQASANSSTETFNVSPSQWFHFCITVSGVDASDQATLSYYVNGQQVGQDTLQNMPITPATTAADLGFGAYRGDNANATQVSGYIAGCRIFDGELTPSQVAKMYKDPKFLPGGVNQALRNLDDIPHGATHVKLDSEFGDTSEDWDYRPKDHLDRIEVTKASVDTCAGGGGLEVEVRPEFAGIQATDEGDYRLWWWVHEDGVLVQAPQSTTNIWDIAGGRRTYSYTDGGAGSDAAGASSHSIEFTLSLMKIDLVNDRCVGTKTAVVPLTYGTC